MSKLTKKDAETKTTREAEAKLKGVMPIIIKGATLEAATIITIIEIIMHQEAEITSEVEVMLEEMLEVTLEA